MVEADLSDSGTVDNVLELLVMAGGRSLPEVKHDSGFDCKFGRSTEFRATQGQHMQIGQQGLKNKRTKRKERKGTLFNCQVF